MELVEDVRARCRRLLTVVLVHHENKGGAVSGAWEGAGDSLLHVQGAGNGHTVVYVQKARWDTSRHGKTLHLEWTRVDGFRLGGERNYLDEVLALLSDNKPRTAKEIAVPETKGGIGASETTITELLDEHQDLFWSRNGKEVGRSARATVWQLRQGVNAVDAVGAFSGGAGATTALRPSLKGAAAVERTPGEQSSTAVSGSAQSMQLDVDAELERLESKFPDLEAERA